jgi:hypothetical protein
MNQAAKMWLGLAGTGRQQHHQLAQCLRETGRRQFATHQRHQPLADEAMVLGQALTASGQYLGGEGNEIAAAAAMPLLQLQLVKLTARIVGCRRGRGRACGNAGQMQAHRLPPYHETCGLTSTVRIGVLELTH